MRFLVDADVLSEQTKPYPNPNVIDWLRDNDPDVVLNPIILGELEFGILKLAAGRRRAKLLEWFTAGVQTLPILSIDAATAAVWASLLVELRRKGRAMPVKDSLIAASARQHDLAVATRNVHDYKYARVELINPFQE
jgi:predicted nucleic acid-binding protein